MNNEHLNWKPAHEIAELIRNKEIRVMDVAEALISQVTAVNPSINAIVAFDEESIRAEASALDAKQDAGEELGPLHGVPYTIKDMTDVAGVPTTNGLKSLKNNVAQQDALLVHRLRNAGGLFAGKTNTPEMGYYGGTDNQLFGPTHNPWKEGYTAGGSSGGAAASVAAGMVPLAEGTDGAGSVRIPASLCGVVGFKPTTGVIPSPFPFLDWAYHGPITRNVMDNAMMLDVIAGHDPGATPAARRLETSFLDDSMTDVSGLRVAWSPDLGLGKYIDPEVSEISYTMVEVLRDLGAHVSEATPPWDDPSLAMWHGIWVPGYAGMLQGIDMDTNPEDFDERLHEIKAEAESTNLAEWGRSHVSRAKLFADWDTFMRDYDLLVSPTLASAAFPLSQFAPSWVNGKSVREEILDWLLTYPFNMLNNPAISIPAGFTQQGLPVGFQISARHWEDARVLGVARALEKAAPWNDQKPTLKAEENLSSY